MHEKRYNPYYGLLAARLCESSKGYRTTFLYAVWDHIRNMAQTKTHARHNLAMVLRHLVSVQQLALNIFKPVEWVGEMHPNLSDFLNIFFANLIADPSVCNNQVLLTLFSSLAKKKSEELKLLRDGMLLFLRFSLSFKKEMVASDVARNLVRNRLSLVKQALQHDEEDVRGEEEDDESG